MLNFIDTFSVGVTFSIMSLSDFVIFEW